MVDSAEKSWEKVNTSIEEEKPCFIVGGGLNILLLDKQVFIVWFNNTHMHTSSLNGLLLASTLKLLS